MSASRNQNQNPQGRRHPRRWCKSSRPPPGRALMGNKAKITKWRITK
uniref:Uncharacterized protein n=1 Tax=Caudovirales sp. ctu3532 TaxID=2827639 RepID=A0A8S5THY0_9CAUD|nr:MAG TPA: hypothetical protein [Caudovirales sp. ctu3532]